MIAARKDIAPLNDHISHLDRQIGVRTERKNISGKIVGLSAAIAIASGVYNMPGLASAIYGALSIPHYDYQISENVLFLEMGAVSVLSGAAIYNQHQDEAIKNLQSEKSAYTVLRDNVLS